MHDYELAGSAAEDYRDNQAEPPSIYRIVRVLSAYRTAIGLGLLAVIVAYIIVAALLLLRAPSQRVVSLPFRLEFSGAGLGRYPNGLKFSGGDIVAGPIAMAAYQRNGLDRFLTLQNFMSSLVVLESNVALEKLTAEYRARLSDARLGPVDRERIHAEFEQKMASLNKADWSLSLVLPDKNGTIPPTVADKVLHDVLVLWADDTARTRKAMNYQVPTFTAHIFGPEVQQEELVIALTTLRSRILDVMGNVQAIEKLPGSALVRSRRTNRSLAEIELDLSDLLRTEVEPLITRAFASGTVRDRAATMGTLEAQREYDARRLAYATRRAEILRAVLNDYVAEQSAASRPGPFRVEGAGTEPSGTPQSGDLVVPQLSDSFLNRLVMLASNDADRDYRQKAVDQIREASLATLPLQTTVTFDEQVIEQARRAGTNGGGAAEATFRAQYHAARREAIGAVNDVNEIFTLLSRNLLPTTQLYAVTGPAMSRIERTLSIFRIALGGLLAFFLAIPVFCVAAFVHNSMLRAQAEDERQHASAVRRAAE